MRVREEESGIRTQRSPPGLGVSTFLVFKSGVTPSSNQRPHHLLKGLHALTFWHLYTYKLHLPFFLSDFVPCQVHMQSWASVWSRSPWEYCTAFTALFLYFWWIWKQNIICIYLRSAPVFSWCVALTADRFGVLLFIATGSKKCFLFHLFVCLFAVTLNEICWKGWPWAKEHEFLFFVDSTISLIHLFALWIISPKQSKTFYLYFMFHDKPIGQFYLSSSYFKHFPNRFFIIHPIIFTQFGTYHMNETRESNLFVLFCLNGIPVS